MGHDKDADLTRTASHVRWLQSPDNPINWTVKRKWLVTLVAAWVAFAAGINATSILTPAAAIGAELGFSDGDFPTSYWTVTSWTMGATIGPMIGMPMLEEFGVRRGYLVCYIAFTLFLIPQAVAQNFATLIVSRIFSGFFSSILQNGMVMVSAEVFATDLERTLPLNLFILVYEGGFTLGPTFAACFPESQWRWVFYTHIIVFAAFFPVLWFTFRETREHVIRTALSASARRVAVDPESDNAVGSEIVLVGNIERPSFGTLVYDALVRPIVLLFTQPVLFALMLWSAFATALVFISTESIEAVFAENFGFSARQIGAVQASIFIGEVVAFIVWLPANSYYVHSAKWNKENPGTPLPEARLMLSIPGSFIGLCGGLFWYAWTSSPDVHWIMPAIGLGLIGFGIVVVVNSVVMYMTDAYTSVAGSAVAGLAMGENLLSAWVPLSTPRMYNALGAHWASSLLGFLALVLSFVPVVLTLYGHRIRARSNLMEGKR